MLRRWVLIVNGALVGTYLWRSRGEAEARRQICDLRDAWPEKELEVGFDERGKDLSFYYLSDQLPGRLYPVRLIRAGLGKRKDTVL